MPAGDVLTAIDGLLDSVESRRSDLPPQTRLEWLRLARRVKSRVDALTGLLTAEADRAQASVEVSGTPLTSWLGVGENVSRREASGAVLNARVFGAHPAVGQAAAAGHITTNQAQAIGTVLNDIAPQLNADQRAQAEGVMVGLAGHLDSAELAGTASRVLASVAGDDRSDQRELHEQRAVEAAHRKRSLRFFREGASIRFDGSLPRLEGEAFIALVDAHGEARRRTAIEARDPLIFDTPEQRRADALAALIQAAQHTKPEPGVGVSRVVVTLSYEQLLERAGAAGVIDGGTLLSEGELRRVCCDAELIPAVLGSASEVLDLGRAARLVSGALRTALNVRDGGCVFPGCDVSPNRCEAHHLRPWWQGGPTSLENLALLCHHHHGVVEPARFGSRDQWQVRIGVDGLVECVPPARLDPAREPIRHRRRGGTGRIARPARTEPPTMPARLGSTSESGSTAPPPSTAPPGSTAPPPSATSPGSASHQAIATSPGSTAPPPSATSPGSTSHQAIAAPPGSTASPSSATSPGSASHLAIAAPPVSIRPPVGRNAGDPRPCGDAPPTGWIARGESRPAMGA